MRQLLQSRRIRRCACTACSVSPSSQRSTPRSSRRCTASAVLRPVVVASTSRPAAAASSASCALSTSRSPSIAITSASACSTACSAAAIGRPARASTSIWRTPGSVASRRSPRETILRSGWLSRLSSASSVVVRPEPAGPTPRIRPPPGRSSSAPRRSWSGTLRPRASNFSALSRVGRPMTMSSMPPWVGSVVTRSSMRCCGISRAKASRPDCGRRCSATSSSASDLMRAISPVRQRPGSSVCGSMRPSRRSRTHSLSSLGWFSMWMALAPLPIASATSVTSSCCTGWSRPPRWPSASRGSPADRALSADAGVDPVDAGVAAAVATGVSAASGSTGTGRSA